jgi:peptidoglycan/xylan/chitin deacetylase (PgdA/CDA1 family)
MFFVSAGNIGTPGFLSRQQIREMQAMGMLIGSHGVNHRAFDIMGIDEARRQMATSKAILEEMLDRPVDHLAFPGGRHNRLVVEAAYEAGYRFLFTMIWGVNHVVSAGPALLRRDVIVRGMSNEEFLDLIVGKNAWGRQSIYWCKQAARSLLPSSIYGTLRRRFISG